MNGNRKTAQARERELRTALSRIRHGRSKTMAARLSIAAVAREAGVTAALIHNHYPDVAAAIREAMGREPRASHDLKEQETKVLRCRVRELNSETRALRTDIARLASINEVLMAENASLKAKLGASSTVMRLSPTSHRAS